MRHSPVNGLALVTAPDFLKNPLGCFGVWKHASDEVVEPQVGAAIVDIAVSQQI